MAGTMILVTILPIITLVAGSFILFAISYRKVPEGFVIIRNGFGGPKVGFSGMIVIPVLHRYDLLGTTIQQIDHSVVLKDCEMNDVPVTISIYIKPNDTNVEDLLMAQRLIGSDGMGANGAVANNIRDMADQAISQVAGKFTAKEIHQKSLEIKEEVIQVMDAYFEGFILEDLYVKP